MYLHVPFGTHVTMRKARSRARQTKMDPHTASWQNGSGKSFQLQKEIRSEVRRKLKGPFKTNPPRASNRGGFSLWRNGGLYLSCSWKAALLCVAETVQEGQSYKIHLSF